jgi:thymidine phosphorylase
VTDAIDHNDIDHNAIDLILTKRDGGRLTDDQIDWFIRSYTDGSVGDEQAAALLMAILFRGLDPAELARWTAQMIATGTRADLSALAKPTVDKHSTGGVGDKISLILCPLVAACGAVVPQTAGRGLGHTGGTLDKMETIPGWRSTLAPDEVLRILGDSGAVINAAGPQLAPADRKLYALRDVTGTVESIPLIASSIMSKKIAEGTSALVLDVKVGTGAFMKDESRARELAETMVGLGAAHGVRTTALLTQMDVPLGRTAGNALEVVEAVEVLAGGGPPDIVELTLALAREMLDLAGLGEVDPAEALANGQAMDAWRAMVRAQGGDPLALLPRAAEVEVVPAPASGTLSRLDALAVGVAAWRLGAGRSRKEDDVSPIAGVTWRATVGDHVIEGETLLELHLDDAARLPGALAALEGAIEVSPTPVDAPPMILGRVS